MMMYELSSCEDGQSNVCVCQIVFQPSMTMGKSESASFDETMFLQPATVHPLRHCQVGGVKIRDPCMKKPAQQKITWG